MITIAERLQKLPPYLFVDLRQKMQAAQARGVDVISLGIGDPDIPTPDPVVETLCSAIQNPEDSDRHRYGCDSPVDDFPQAVLDFYQHRYGVPLSDDQVVTTLGSKDAIVKMALGILNPGDIGIAASPGYPTYNIGHVFASATTYYAPLLRENDFFVDFDAIPDEVKRLAKVLWINYPNNPTTATADLDFFERAVEFGRQNNILIAHDNAYSENTYDGYRSPSILQVEGAAEVAVEFFSLSKAFNMTGWRLGFVVGNPTVVGTIKAVKDNIDKRFTPLASIRWCKGTLNSRRDYTSDKCSLSKTPRYSGGCTYRQRMGNRETESDNVCLGTGPRAFQRFKSRLCNGTA